MSLLQKGKNVLDQVVFTLEISPQFLSVPVVVKSLLQCFSLEQTILIVLAAMESTAMENAHAGVRHLQQAMELVICPQLMVIGCIRSSVPVVSSQKH